MITYNLLQSTLSSYPTPPTIGLPLWAYSSGARVTEPPDSQKLSGWVPILGQEIGQKPPYQWVNWLCLSTGTWIQYLQTASAQLIVDVTELQVNVADLQSRVTVLESKVAALQLQVGSLESQVAFLKARQTCNISGTSNDWYFEVAASDLQITRVQFVCSYFFYNTPDGTWDSYTLVSFYKTLYHISVYTIMSYELIVDSGSGASPLFFGPTNLVINMVTPHGPRKVYDQVKIVDAIQEIGFNTYRIIYNFPRWTTLQSVFLDIGQQAYFLVNFQPNILDTRVTVLKQAIRANNDVGNFVLSIGF
jgi:cell division protein FtsB